VQWIGVQLEHIYLALTVANQYAFGTPPLNSDGGNVETRNLCFLNCYKDLN
jgi:hypothetical protein